MIVARCYLQADALETIPEIIPELPEAIRPTHFGESEDEKGPRFSLSGKGAKGGLQQRAHSGYFLFTNQTVYTVSPSDNGAELFVSNEQGQLTGPELNSLMRSLRDHGLKFGFVAEWEEYLHRNRFIYELPNGKVQSWVGRDLSKYLPGLYWTNVLSNELAHRFGIEDCRLPSDAQILDFGSGYFSCRLFDRANDWTAYASQIDVLCEKNPHIFSIGGCESNLIEHQTTWN
jgi:hypothetical protein